MARQYTVGDDTCPISGNKLTELALSVYESNKVKFTGVAKPVTVEKAIWFFTNIMKKKVHSKLETSTIWCVMK
jgi:hypothetical protein